jgi:UDP-N-acetylglucosamine 1-carboxyvinyltransferase
VSDNKNDILHVEGGKPLNGTIKVRGAKNFVSKAMVAALLAPGTSVLKNVPEIRDVHVVSDLLRLHGVDVTVDGANGVVTIDATNVQLADVADVDTLSGSSRIPILFSGPLLHRLGEAFIPALGGCNIGGRPIDFHLETLRKLGANVDKEHKDGTSPLRTVCMARRSTCRTRPWAPPSRRCSPPCSPKARPSFPAPPSNLRSWIW